MSQWLQDLATMGDNGHVSTTRRAGLCNSVDAWLFMQMEISINGSIKFCYFCKFAVLYMFVYGVNESTSRGK